MNTYTFDISVDAWIRNIDIEANSREEAEDELREMSLQDLVETGYVKDFDISNIDCDVEYGEKIIDVKATDIIYAEEDDAGYPTELDLEVIIPNYVEDEDEIKQLVLDEIETKVGAEVESFNYEIK